MEKSNANGGKTSIWEMSEMRICAGVPGRLKGVAWEQDTWNWKKLGNTGWVRGSKELTVMSGAIFSPIRYSFSIDHLPVPGLLEILKVSSFKAHHACFLH